MEYFIIGRNHQGATVWVDSHPYPSMELARREAEQRIDMGDVDAHVYTLHIEDDHRVECCVLEVQCCADGGVTALRGTIEEIRGCKVSHVLDLEEDCGSIYDVVHTHSLWGEDGQYLVTLPGGEQAAYFLEDGRVEWR